MDSKLFIGHNIIIAGGRGGRISRVPKKHTTTPADMLPSWCLAASPPSWGRFQEPVTPDPAARNEGCPWPQERPRASPPGTPPPWEGRREGRRRWRAWGGDCRAQAATRRQFRASSPKWIGCHCCHCGLREPELRPKTKNNRKTTKNNKNTKNHKNKKLKQKYDYDVCKMNVILIEMLHVFCSRIRKSAI